MANESVDRGGLLQISCYSKTTSIESMREDATRSFRSLVALHNHPIPLTWWDFFLPKPAFFLLSPPVSMLQDCNASTKRKRISLPDERVGCHQQSEHANSFQFVAIERYGGHRLLLLKSYGHSSFATPAHNTVKRNKSRLYTVNIPRGLPRSRALYHMLLGFRYGLLDTKPHLPHDFRETDMVPIPCREKLS